MNVREAAISVGVAVVGRALALTGVSRRRWQREVDRRLDYLEECARDTQERLEDGDL